MTDFFRRWIAGEMDGWAFRFLLVFAILIGVVGWLMVNGAMGADVASDEVEL